jgi:broad specificity phosphatase PhoE
VSDYEGTMDGITLAYLVQHGEKEPLPGDPGLTGTGRQQATRTGRWLLGAGVRALYTSPMRRARETADCIASVTGLAVQPDARRLAGFLAGLPAAPGPVAVVTHGGITVDLLRNLLGDDAVPPQVLTEGIPPCAITAVDDLTVVTIASMSHLS